MKIKEEGENKQKKKIINAKHDKIWPYTSSQHRGDNEMIKKPP